MKCCVACDGPSLALLGALPTHRLLTHVRCVLGAASGSDRQKDKDARVRFDETIQLRAQVAALEERVAAGEGWSGARCQSLEWRYCAVAMRAVVSDLEVSWPVLLLCRAMPCMFDFTRSNVELALTDNRFGATVQPTRKRARCRSSSRSR